MLQGETNRAMEQNIKSRNRCSHNGHLIFDYNGTAAQCRKDELFNKWYWSNWILTWGIKWNWIPTLHKSIPGSVKTYMLKLKTRKLLEENTRKSSLPWGSRKFLKQALTIEKDFITLKSKTSIHPKTPEWKTKSE